MAVVYLGRHVRLNQPRAIKIISTPLMAQERYIRLFYREAQLAAALRHPNIVHIYDVGEENGLPYIVMELLEGRSLSDLIRAGEPLPLARVVHVVQQLADALDYAHQHDVAH